MGIYMGRGSNEVFSQILGTSSACLSLISQLMNLPRVCQLIQIFCRKTKFLHSVTEHTVDVCKKRMRTYVS